MITMFHFSIFSHFLLNSYKYGKNGFYAGGDDFRKVFVLADRKHSRESNVIVTRPKTARYDVYTLIKIGIDRRGLLQPLPQCLQEMLHSEKAAELTALQLVRYPPTSSLYCLPE